MSDFKKFLIRLSVFGSSVFLVFALLILAADRLCHDDYLSATIDKHQNLAKVTKSRIVVVGGSATAFGLDSPYLTEALEKPVVNMAVHGSLGLSYQISEVDSQLQKGDTLVIIPEFFNFFGSYDGDSATLLELVCQAPSSVQWMSGKQIGYLLSGTPSLLQKKLKTVAMAAVKRQSGEGIYARRAFNTSGDVVAHLGKPTKKFATSVLDPDTFDPSSIDQLAKTATEIGARGIKVVILIPAFDVNYWDKNRTAIEKFDRRLKEKMTIPVLGTPESCHLPTELFFDTSWHLNAEGRRVLNSRVAKELLPIVKD